MFIIIKPWESVFVFVCVCVDLCVRMCVCVCERERERERECVCVCVSLSVGRWVGVTSSEMAPFRSISTDEKTYDGSSICKQRSF